MILLWTNSVLEPARRIYERAGFSLVHSEAHHSFGHDLVGETRELKLRRERPRLRAGATTRNRLAVAASDP